jgi:hypothetical protein
MDGEGEQIRGGEPEVNQLEYLQKVVEYSFETTAPSTFSAMMQRRGDEKIT